MLRILSDEYVQALVATRFWAGVRADDDLFPEIRREAVTVYYCGAALISNLRLNGCFTGTTHPKYIPIRTATKGYVEFTADGGDLDFAGPVEAWPIGDANAEVLQAYKSQMSRIGGPENRIIHSLCRCPSNVIVDQEIKFQLPGIDGADKIDILSFDSEALVYSFVEVKGITDCRLREGTSGLRDVALQLQRYGERIQVQANAISSAIDQIVTLKSRLGLGHRVRACQGVAGNRLMRKPVLVIGGCSQQEVQDILLQRDHWASLLESVQGVAAGLVLCGNDGTRLDLKDGKGRRWFDRELVT